MMSKAFIKHLIDDCDGELSSEKVSEHLYTELKLIEEITAGVKCINAALRDEEKRHGTKLSELNTGRDNLQGRCKHWDRIYHPDPSGNNDSHYECSVCGKYF